MAKQYGTVKIDFITYTSGTTGNETDVTIPVSGLSDTAESGITITGDITARNITATGDLSVTEDANVSGLVTTSGLSVTGTADVNALNVTGLAAVGNLTATGSATATTFTGNLISGISGIYTNLSGASITGNLISGTSGVYAYLSGTSITGNVGQFQTATISGLVVKGDLTVSGNIISSGLTLSGITGFFESGTVSSPSISFVDDIDTGFYNATANEIRATASGADVLTINSTGLNVAGNVNATSFTGNGSGLTGIVVDTAANCSRSVLTGVGLTGGGELNQDITITVDSTVVRTFTPQIISGIKTFRDNVVTNKLLVGTSNAPTSAPAGTLVVEDSIQMYNLGAQDNNGRFQIYVGEEQSITSSGVIQFTFSTSPTTTRSSALLKITISWQNNNNNIFNQPAIQFFAQINNNQSGATAVGTIEPVYEWRNTVASDVTFTNLNSGQCRFDVVNTVGSSSQACYKIEVLSYNGRIDLTSISKT